MKFALATVFAVGVIQTANAFQTCKAPALFPRHLNPVASRPCGLFSYRGDDFEMERAANKDFSNELINKFSSELIMNKEKATDTPPQVAQKRRVRRDTNPAVTVQGGSLRTWSFASSKIDRIRVELATEGRPLDADIELWQGPDNTPHKMRVYLENGDERPFNALIETPRGPNTVAVRNIAQLEFPLMANIYVDSADGSEGPLEEAEESGVKPLIIQGGALRTYPFSPDVESVQVLLKTDGRPLRARIELLQGPNNNKQVVEVYTEDGMDRPFYMAIETPGSGNVVRVVNTATVEFPMTAWVEPLRVGSFNADNSVIVSGDDYGGFMGGGRGRY